MQNLRAVLYVRVSSDKQIGNTSITDQKKLGQTYCTSQNIELAEIFEELGESAKFDDREELKRALKYCAVRNVDYFLVYKYDRFSRSVEFHHKIKATLSRYGVKLVSMTEPVEDSPSGRFLENMLAGVAQFDNEVRSERSIKGMKSRLEQGLFPFNAPLGYIDNKNTPGLKHPDPQRFESIQKAIKMMLTGGYRIHEMVVTLQQWGIRTKQGNPITDSRFGEILRNPFYAGIIDCKRFGVRQQGQHEAMISAEEFYRLQELLPRLSNRECTKYNTFNDEFFLNKLILCHGCDKPLCGSWAKKGKRFGYYSCRAPKCLNRTKGRKEDIENAFMQLLHRVTPKDELVNLYRANVIDVFEEKLGEKRIVQTRVKGEVEKLEARRNRVQELLEDGVYNTGQYRERFETIETELSVWQGQLSDANIEVSELETLLNYAMVFLQQLPKFWMQLKPAGKFRLYRFLFPEQLRWENGVLTTPRLGLVYKQIEDAHKGQLRRGATQLEILQLIEYLRGLAGTICALEIWTYISHPRLDSLRTLAAEYKSATNTLWKPQRQQKI